jgi:hypothetical protein
MKTNLARFLSVLSMLAVLLFSSGCVEHRYYREHHEHSPEYNHHHQPEQPSVNLDIHN